MSFVTAHETTIETTIAEPPVLEWCTPVIHDCLEEFYCDLLPRTNGARDLMTERHFALWSALVREDFDHLRADVVLLATQARSLCLDFRTCRAADHYIGGEILDVSQRRFRRMPFEARVNTAALLVLLKRLEEERSLRMAPEIFTRAA